MSLKSWSVLVLGLAVTTIACSEPQAEGQTTDLTRSLLAEPAGDGVSTPTPIAADPSLADEDSPRIPVSMVGINRGSEEAPVKVVEMSDYGCSYCRRFHQQTFPTLKTQFIDSGMVEWKFVPYVTGMWEESLPATEAAECTVAQSVDAFETLNTRLWGEQSVWKTDSDPAGVVRGWVSELGVDMAAYDQCLAQDERLQNIAASTTLARQLGVRGTPTFIVVGYPPIQGALPLETFQKILTAVHKFATDPDAQAEAERGGDGA